MSRYRKAWVPILLATTVSLLFCATAIAEDQPTAEVSVQDQTTLPSTPQKAASADDDNWHFGITPYLWFAGVSGTVGALGHDAGVHVSPGDLLSHFHIGLMANVEARKNRLVLPLDFMWINLQDAKALP